MIEIGSVFSRWTVLENKFRVCGSRKKLYCVCRCQCGSVKEVAECKLKASQSRSCGCLVVDEMRAKKTTHGEADKTPEFIVWQSMNGRCRPGTGDPDYFNRGIIVCERWKTYTNFLEDMCRRPSPQHSIDRINNDGNYEPSNCRWATKSEQARNKRCSRRFTFYGRNLHLYEWCEISQLQVGTVLYRLSVGWSEKRAIWTPSNRKKVAAK